MINSIPDFIDSLSRIVEGEIRVDSVSRVLYSTDASIYQIEPLGVFFPRSSEEISAFLEAANIYEIPLVPRGAGSSLAGQSIGPGFILDCSRHLDQIISINPSEMSAIIEPGVILADLNIAAADFGLQFGPDPASQERATLGGVIANNATGAQSISFGMAADHIISLELTLDDGSQANFREMPLDAARNKARLSNREGEIYRSALSIRNDHFDEIVAGWPKTWRRASGYNLNYLMPWSPSAPPQWGGGSRMAQPGSSAYPPVTHGSINLASLIAGSEGTLGVINRAEIRLVPKPAFTCLTLLAYENLVSTCDDVPRLLDLKPSAIELIPANMIRLARSIPSFAKQAAVLEDLVGNQHEFPNLLAVEFSGSNLDELKELAQMTAELSKTPSLVVPDPGQQAEIWNLRKVGLGILMSIPGDLKPIPFVEDVAVPVNKLGQFVSGLEVIMTEHGTSGDFYAHASAGCLHIRPLINLKQAAGIGNMRVIAAATIELISSLGGAPSGEHGDGIARSEWLPKIFGPEIIDLFGLLKNAADPKGLLNPGKIVDPFSMDDHLRYGPDYSASGKATFLDFSAQDGFIGAIEMCNGAGVCRKSAGVMCPSFQATQEELHSTRGRANLLRNLLEDKSRQQVNISPDDVFNALDLCLACKGCKSECPSAVDMAKLKYEFLDHYYASRNARGRPIRDYLFAYIGEIARFGAAGKTLANFVLRKQNVFGLGTNLLGFTDKRYLPTFENMTLEGPDADPVRNSTPGTDEIRKQVLYLGDSFTDHFQPDIGIAARRILDAAGCEIHIIPVSGAGRTKLSKGFLSAARKQAEKVIRTINQIDPGGSMPVVGVEPSEIYTLKDEYPDFFPGDERVRELSARSFMLDEYLLRLGEQGSHPALRIDIGLKDENQLDEVVFLHGHCYQKAQPPAADGLPVGIQATQAMLEQVGYRVELIDAGCCGMAGAFGYEAEHYELSMEIGELSLFPQVRKAGQGAIISACGFSCLSQIRDGTGLEARHFVSLVHDRIFKGQI